MLLLRGMGELRQGDQRRQGDEAIQQVKDVVITRHGRTKTRRSKTTRR